MRRTHRITMRATTRHPPLVRENRIRSLIGFTMLEMLVAVTVTVVMVLFLNQVFTAMSGAVSTGLATSDIIQSSHVASSQLREDARLMKGWNLASNGFLVILQKQYNSDNAGYGGLRLRKDDSLASVNRPVRVRSDQLMWVRGTSGATPRTPESNASFADATSGATDVRVWYGHVARTNPLGNVSDPLGLGANAVASEWVLGRQLLFMDPAPPGIFINSTGTFLNNQTWFLDTADAINYPLYSGPAIPSIWNKGLNDVFDRDLNEIVAAITAVGGPGYPFGLYQLMYGNASLWCNIDSEGDDAYQLAQKHAYFVGNVSDFKVDFAGDYLTNDPLTRLPNFFTGKDDLIDYFGGQVMWYSYYWNVPDDPDLPDPLDLYKGRQHVGGGVTVDYDPTKPTAYPFPVAPASPEGFVETGTVATPVNAIADIDPELVPGGGPMAGAEVGFVWCPQPDHGYLRWPYMIRIGYRVHDSGGRLAGDDGRLGKQFERIIRVRNTLGAFEAE